MLQFDLKKKKEKEYNWRLRCTYILNFEKICLAVLRFRIQKIFL